MMYGDLIMNVANQVRPYEVNPGDTAAPRGPLDARSCWTASTRATACPARRCAASLTRSAPTSSPSPSPARRRSGSAWWARSTSSSRPLGNNQLEQFLLDEGAEPVVPGLTDFMIFKIYNRVSDVDMFGGSKLKQLRLPVLHGLHRKMPAGHDRRPEHRPASAPPAPLPSCTSSSTATWTTAARWARAGCSPPRCWS